MKLTCYIICAAFLFQSCVAYQKVPVTLEEAVNQGSVRMETPIDIIDCKVIIYEDSTYYAIRMDNDVRMRISEENAETITLYLKDPDKSKAQSALLTVGIIAGVGLIGSLILLGKMFEETGNFINSLK